MPLRFIRPQLAYAYSVFQTLAKVTPLYRDLAKEYNLAFAPELIGTLLREESDKSDAVHFNAQGYCLVAEELHDLLDRSGAL